MLLSRLCQDKNFTDYNRIESLIKHGSDINYIPPKSRSAKKTPLIYAIENKNCDLIIKLIEYGSNVNFRTNRGNKASILEYLLQQSFSKDDLNNILQKMFLHGLVVDKHDFSLTFKYDIDHYNMKFIIDKMTEINEFSLIKFSNKKHMKNKDIFKYIYDKKIKFNFDIFLNKLIYEKKLHLPIWIYDNIPHINKDNLCKVAISANNYRFVRMLIEDNNICDDFLVLLANKVKYSWRGWRKPPILYMEPNALKLAEK